MKRFLILSFAVCIIVSCSKDDAGLANESWPKIGYLFTTDDDGDTVYVEPTTVAMTTLYSPSFPLTDLDKKWTISLPLSGEGVIIKNDNNRYWSIDSAFHPGLMVEQHFISTRSITDPANISNFNRFKVHPSGNGNSFYLESVQFPGGFVTGLGHAESGRGLRIRTQTNGNWEFWLQNQ